MVMRFKFTRDERVRFLSHLDVLRMFQRAFRRSGIPVAYSKGFNPHPEFVIGLPLAVGVTGDGEYCDVGLEADVTEEEFVKELDSVMPAGYRVVQASVRRNHHNIMAEISLLLAEITFYDCDGLFEAVEAMMSKEHIMVEKVGKKKSNRIPRLIDIKDMIYYAGVEGRTVYTTDTASSVPEIGEAAGARGLKKGSVLLLCSAGSAANLKPELFGTALKEQLSREWAGHISVHRYGTYIRKGNDIFSPMSPMALEER